MKTGMNLYKDDALAILGGTLDVEKDVLNSVKLSLSPYVTFSRNVFVPLTHACRNNCGYCNFRMKPGIKNNILKKKDAIAMIREAETLGCSEVLFTFGERPEVHAVVRRELSQMGYASIIEYLADLCEHITYGTSLFAHSNPGVLEKSEIADLKDINASMGLMLETSSERLMQEAAHKNSPGKDPKLRLESIRMAGKCKVAFTTGLLIGIGETNDEIYESLMSLRKIHDKYGHIQEIIIQNFVPKKGTLMQDVAPVSLEKLKNVIKVARLLFPDVALQVPPNLNKMHLMELLELGVDDLGGISPLTPDYVNPGYEWPKESMLPPSIRERLPIYPRFINKEYLSEHNYEKAMLKVDEKGFVKTDDI